MRTIIITLFFVLFTFNNFSDNSISRTNIRGKVVFYNTYNYQYSPLQFATIVLWKQNANGNWEIVKETITNADGLYYLYDIQTGIYYIKVNGLKNYQINVIATYPPGTWQDLQVLYF